MKALTIRRVALDTLVPDPANPRLHDERTHEPRPEYIEPPEALATQLIILHPSIENPGELPEGVA